VGVGELGARAADGVGDGADRLFLPDDALREARLHLEELRLLALEHLRRRDTGPARDDGGDVLRVDELLHHRLVALELRELLLELLLLLLEAGITP
jgi:hypothetical protein